MSDKSISLINSYKVCHKIFKKNAKTYYIGSLLFDYEKFLHICAFYGLVRVVDDIVDLEKDIDKKIDKIQNFESTFFSIIDKNLHERKLLINNNLFWKNYHNIMRAVINTSNVIGISREIYSKFFKSMKMDLYKYHYNNYNELEEYMDGSAAVIGEVMLNIIKHNNKAPIYNTPDMIKYARKLGYAFQLTNFIRDIKEDMDMIPSRIYIPIDDQKKFKCNLKEYNSIKNDKNFKNLIEFQLKRCDKIYQSANIGINKIDANNRFSILISKILYSEINNKIRKNNYNISNRTRINSCEKFSLLFNELSFCQFIRIIFVILFNYVYYNILLY